MTKINLTATETRRAAVAAGPKTHEGAPAAVQTAEGELRRMVASCLLWEDTFYEKGTTTAARIATLCETVALETLAQIAIGAREDLYLRHVPLWLCRQMARRGGARIIGDTLARVIQRADELAEFLALYWKDGKDQPIAAQVKRGLAVAFPKFDAYQLGKYNRDEGIKLRDVLFLSHATPKDEAQAAVWKQLIDGTLPTPDTWEVALSAGKDKRETWVRLLAEKKLGGLALLRNLRNMREAGVPEGTVRAALAGYPWPKGRILPFRFIAASRVAPWLEDALDVAMLSSLSQAPKLPGRTLFVVDASASMSGPLHAKSDLNRIDAAAALAILLRETCEQGTIYATAGNDFRQTHATGQVPARRGMALRDAIQRMPETLGGGGIFLVQCMAHIAKHEPEPFDRVIVFTDEQDCDRSTGGSAFLAKRLGRRNYVLNVASYSPALDLREGWVRLSGFSDRVVDWMRADESGQWGNNAAA